VSNDAYPVINPAKKNMFQRRIMGLVSHYIGSTPEFYAKKIINYVDVPMSEYQAYIYKHYEEIEEKIARKSRSSSSGNYKSYTRQSCNFVFPIMSQGLSGETRPRPRDFKINESELESITKGKSNMEQDKDKEKYYQVSEYLSKTEEFINAFDSYLSKKLMDDITKKHTLVNDLEYFKKKTNMTFEIDDFVAYINDPNIKKSDLLMALHSSSAKMTFMIFNIMVSSGPVLIYSNYVVMEGLQIFKIYLKYFGFSAYVDRNRGTDNFRYMEYHGGIDPIERRRVLEIFNRKENKIGEVCKIVMISPAGAEGISLNNIRQVHIMEPYWHEVRITQMIGRAIRQCSHRDLPMEDRSVVVFRYKSVRNGSKWTTDQYIEDMARSKEGLIQSFLDAMKEGAIDCALFSTHNSLMGSYRCFQFDEKTLFDQQIGPAYKEDIYDDAKMDNGLNSQNSRVRRIKVIKIKAVKQLVENINDETIDSSKKFTEPSDYWFNPETNVVYDFELQYPIGKVGTDELDMPMKLDTDTFIINKMIPIPILKNN
jgi:hypothetical protein